jgi:hypothetical protein
VIDVGESGVPTASLHISDPDARKTYVALSYCWGAGNQFKTTTSTLPDLVHGFQISSLPKTIQDGIQVTREFGFRYLRVYSLCILQGSDEEARRDWPYESALMHDIYSDAVFTIVAAAL